MEIKTRNTLIGAGAGAAVGGAIGGVASVIKNKNFMAQIETAQKELSLIDADAYIKEHCKAAKYKQIKAGLKPTKIQKNMKKVMQKATEDINATISRLNTEIKNLKKSKNKTIIALVGIGIAAGALIGGIAARLATKNSTKTEQTQQQ